MLKMAGIVGSEGFNGTMASQENPPQNVNCIDGTDTNNVNTNNPGIKKDPDANSEVRVTYVCKICSFRGVGLPVFMEHLKDSHPSSVPNPIFVCRNCQLRTPDYDLFMKHNTSARPCIRKAEAPEVTEAKQPSAKPAPANVPAQNKITSAKFLPLDAGAMRDNSGDAEDGHRQSAQVGTKEPVKAADIPLRVSSSPEVINESSSAARANDVNSKISTPRATVAKTEAVNDTFASNARPMNRAASASPATRANPRVLSANALSSKVVSQNSLTVEPLRTAGGTNKIVGQNELKVTASKKSVPKQPQVEPPLNPRQEGLRYPPARSSKVSPMPNGKKEPLKNISGDLSDVHTASSVDEDFEKMRPISSDHGLTISIPSNSIPSYNPAMDLNPFLINSLRKFPYPQRTEICYLALVTGHTQLEVAIWFMGQRLLNGISWTPEEVDRIKRQGFVTNCTRIAGNLPRDSGTASENALRAIGDKKSAAAEDKQSSSNQRETSARAASPRPASETSTLSRKRKAQDDSDDSDDSDDDDYDDDDGGGLGGTGAKKLTRKTQQQLSVLQACFARNKYANQKERRKIAKQTNLKPTQVKAWFQRQRVDLRRTSANRPVDAADTKVALQSQDKMGTEATLPNVVRNGNATQSNSGNEKTEAQLTALEASFEERPWLSEDELDKLKTETKLARREIKEWFSDRRRQHGIAEEPGAAKHEEVAESRKPKVARDTNDGSEQSVPSEPDKGSIEVVLENDDNRSDDSEDDDDGDRDGHSQGDRKDSTAISVKTVKLPQGQLNTAPMLGNLEAKSAETSVGLRRFKTQYQLGVLIASFSTNPILSQEEVRRLVEVTNLTREDIVIFFKRKKSESQRQKNGLSKGRKKSGTAGMDSGLNKIINDPVQNSKSPKSKPGSRLEGTRKTQEQLNMLKTVFARTRWPTNEEYVQMVAMTNLARPVIVSWFGDMRYGAKHKTLRWLQEFKKARRNDESRVTKSHESSMETPSSSPKSSLPGDKMSVDEERSENNESQQMEDEDEEGPPKQHNEDVLKSKGKKAARRGERRDGYSASDVTDNSDNWPEGTLSEEEPCDDECSNVGDDSELKSV